MSNLTETLNSWASAWFDWSASNLASTAAVLAVAALIWLPLRRHVSPSFGYWLFMLVMIKPMIPTQISLPADWLPFAPAPGQAPAVDGAVAGPIVPEGAATPTPANGPISWKAYLGCAWLLVVAALSARLFWAQRGARRWAGRSTPLGRRQPEVDDLAATLGLRGRVAIYSHPDLKMPVVCGLLRPRLIVPVDFFDLLPREQRRWVLLHELAHLKRGDLWALALQRLVGIAQFFNPSVWIASRTVDRLREYACDDLAIVQSDTRRDECGEGFVRVVESASLSQPPAGAVRLALFEHRSESKRRLARILDSRRRLEAGIGPVGMASIALLGIVLLPGLHAEGDQDATTASLRYTESAQPAARHPDAPHSPKPAPAPKPPADKLHQLNLGMACSRCHSAAPEPPAPKPPTPRGPKPKPAPKPPADQLHQLNLGMACSRCHASSPAPHDVATVPLHDPAGGSVRLPH